jgi:excisionase family DNA binding protein
MTGRELAETLGERYETVMEWARLGRIPSLKSGHRVWFNLDRVLEALSRSTAGIGAPVASIAE